MASFSTKSSGLKHHAKFLLVFLHLAANKELAPAEKESGQKTQERLDRQRTDPQRQTASTDMDSLLTAGERSSASDKSISLDVGHSLNQRTESNVSNRSTRREPRSCPGEHTDPKGGNPGLMAAEQSSRGGGMEPGETALLFRTTGTYHTVRERAGVWERPATRFAEEAALMEK